MALLMTRTDFYGLIFHSWMSPISPDLAKIGMSDQSIQTIIATSLIGLDNSNMFISLIVPLIICAILLKYIFSSDKKLSNDNLLSGELCRFSSNVCLVTHRR